MSDPKSTVRYLGYRSLRNGSRIFDFSWGFGVAKPTMITIEASPTFFVGPDRIALQEAAGICYETVKDRLQSEPDAASHTFDLTAGDVAQHRRITKSSRSRS